MKHKLKKIAWCPVAILAKRASLNHIGITASFYLAKKPKHTCSTGIKYIIDNTGSPNIFKMA